MNALDKFFKITGYNILDFNVKYRSFMNNDFGKIVSYYKGNSSVDKSCFHNLLSLIVEVKKIDSLFSINSSSLSDNLQFWELQDSISSYRTSLEKVLNIGKWMRSSYTLGFENDSKISYILKQGESLERLISSLGSNSPNEDWVEIALDNSLDEGSYDLSGGNKIKVKNIDSNRQYNIQTTVDFMVGENILGKDIDVFLQFEDDDVLSLSPKDTLIQSAYICLTTVKGSVPKFINLGLSKNFIGSNVFTYKSGALLREILSNFRTDDAFKTVELVDFEFKEDVVRYDFRILSKLNDEVNISM